MGEIIISDFAPCYTDAALKQKPNNLRHVRITNQENFNKSFATNIGIKLSCYETVLCCDADVLIPGKSLQTWKSISKEKTDTIFCLRNVVESSNGYIRPGYGITFGPKQIFEAVDGYDSSYIGWGFEDLDFLSRVDKKGFKIIYSGEGLHISHDDKERMQNYQEKSRQLSREKNLIKYELTKHSSSTQGTMQADYHQYLSDKNVKSTYPL